MKKLSEGEEKLLKYEIMEEIHPKVRSEIEREKQQLLAQFRYVRRAFVVVAGAFAVTGWLGWQDILRRIDNIAETRLDEHLANSPPAKYEEDVQKIYNRVLISSLKKGEGSFYQVDELLAILMSIDSTDDQCIRILEHLDSLHFGLQSSPKFNELKRIVFSSSKPDWIDNSAARLSYLIKAITYLKDTTVSHEIIRLLQDENLDTHSRLALIEYVDSNDLLEAEPLLEHLSSEDNIPHKVREESLKVLMNFNPNSKIVKREISKLLSTERLSPDEVYFLFELFMSLPSEEGDDNNVKSIREFKGSILERLILERNSFYLKIPNRWYALRLARKLEVDFQEILQTNDLDRLILIFKTFQNRLSVSDNYFFRVRSFDGTIIGAVRSLSRRL